MRVACIQMRSGTDPDRNAEDFQRLVAEAAGANARYVQTPEMTGLVQKDRAALMRAVRPESDDRVFAAAARQAKEHDIWLHVGSTPILREDGKVANRAALFAPDGTRAATYDKIHMFDVEISETETYRESDGYQPGDAAVMGDVDGIPVGLTICYDVRFPYLYRGMAKAGAKVMTVPSAFSPETGAAHWEVLLRARAIETGSYILAPAQCGEHRASRGRARRTHGHSMAVDPWGRVLADGGDMPGVIVVDLDPGLVDDVRRRLPSLSHERQYKMV